MNSFIMKNKIFFLKLGFYSANFILIVFYLFPGSILGCFFYDNCFRQPHITPDFIISSNHFYAFIVLTTLGIFSHIRSKKIDFLFLYLILLSVILELLHLVIPNRGFELSDLFGNIAGIIFVIIIYKVKNRYA
ncbi:MAG: hypothetical protein ABS16_01715 [Pelagibacteraceae bacterium BACL20 MAG-120920-bin64]|nr:MAG: hypothetical protein ABS16_01715 [Pelagibacteraceae bacterium BACL20 MAG-120920-bin64]